MTINHPHMTPQWFDAAVHRACGDGCRVIETGRPGVLFVTSGTVAGLTYRVTRTNCGCKGFERHRKCKHVALACAWADVFRYTDNGTRLTPDEAA